MHVHEALARQVREFGVSTMFGVIGEGNLYVVDAYRALEGTSYVAAAHEAGAVLMASGYAQVGRTVGVATVTHGPGLTNTITALVDASRTRVPLVLIAGEVPAHDGGNVQAIDQALVLSGTEVEVVRAGSAQDAVARLHEALERARLLQRPVVYLVPADLLWEPLQSADPGVVAGTSPPDAAGVEVLDLDDALGLLASARRPVVLAGLGAVSGRGRAALIELGRLRGARLSTTLRAKDLFRGIPGEVGICGSYATTLGAEALGRSDCIVAFGASLNQYTTMDGSMLAGKKVVQVDHDGDAIGRHSPVDASVVGDVATVAEAMCDLLRAAGIASSGYDTAALDLDGGRRWAPVPPSGQLDAFEVASTLERLVPADRTLVPDAGRFLHLAYRVFSNPPLDGYVHGLGFGAIGIGLAQAIGAWFARPNRPVLHITGDGGFMLGGLTELHTAVRHGADVVIVVINDGSYGAEHIQLRRRDRQADVSMMAWPRIAELARAMGMPSLTVATEADLAGLPGLLGSRSGPVLVEVLLDPDQLNSLVP